MENLKIVDKYKKVLTHFTSALKDIYGDALISLILYGSAASGEFIAKRSNLNVLAVLKTTELNNLSRASQLIRKFAMVNTLFLTQDYITSSLDVFPIEFLDMQENHIVVFGKDILKDVHINSRNLRFQCEQELKAKLLTLRHNYVKLLHNGLALRRLLFVSFTSVLHIARNVLRIKGVLPPYAKPEIIKELKAQFNIEGDIWEKILAAKNNQLKISRLKTEELFVRFVKEVELLVDIIDKL